MTDTEALIEEICSRWTDVHYEAQSGGLYIDTPTHDVYATPGWEGDWSAIPVDAVEHATGEMVSSHIPVNLTESPSLSTAASVWRVHVLSWISLNLPNEGA